MTDEELLEKLALLEHDQWMAWTYTQIVKLEKAMDTGAKLPQETDFQFLSNEIAAIIRGWDKNRKPYLELTEEVKEFDREWARKVLELIRQESTKK